MRPFRPAVFGWLALSLGCGSRGAVTFDIRAPSVTELSPFSDPRVSEYLVKSSDGALLAAASPRPGSSDPLALGPLAAAALPEDVVMSVMAGTELLGMARIRDVSIRPGVMNTYVADVRKPFVFVGSALPDEFNVMNHVQATQILDPATSKDLASALAMENPPVKLPVGVGAATVTSDGRFILAGHTLQGAGMPGLTIVDTGSGQSVGELPLGFAPWRVVAAARDVAVALLDATEPDGGVLLFPDVAALTKNPAAAVPIKILLRGDTPRTAAFAPDGQSLFVLTGPARNLDPCGSAPAPAPNSIQIYGLDGQSKGGFTLPTFAGDLAVDPASGRLFVSQPLTGEVGAISPSLPSGPATVEKLLGNTVCPSALHVTNGELYVVTAEDDPTAVAPNYRVKHLPVAGGAAANLAFEQPMYSAQVNESDSKDGKVAFNLNIRPKFFYAYDLAISPDASRLAFATRSHYLEDKAQNFMLIAGFACQPTVEIVEYGRYSLDTRTGAATYEMHSQLVTSPAQGKPCINCDNGFFALAFACPTNPGDRPAGVTAVFGNP